MPIPKRAEMRIPFLENASDRQEHRISDVIDKLAEKFKLTDEERYQPYESGSGILFDNRVRWVRQDLIDLGFITSPNRGTVQITDAGYALLQPSSGTAISQAIKNQDPETDALDTIDQAFRIHKTALREKLLARIVTELTSSAFERLVIALVLKMGYGFGERDSKAGKVTGKSGDGGVDGIVLVDKLGLERILIQAKKWDIERGVGSDVVTQFAGALDRFKATKGVIVTSSRFTLDAKAAVPQFSKTIVLIDGDYLVELMYEYDIGVKTSEVKVIKSLDDAYLGSL